ncbi:MAG: tetratricopeptide repeat protein [Propionibacteriaceae bacterium]|nr:tetratricopeptide repeat protein [Propionibacteriaceae bacterium]
MTDPNFSRPGAVDLSSLTSPAAPAAGGYVVEVGEADFQDLATLSMKHPVIVEFHSARDTGGPALSQDLAELVNAGEGRYLLARVDVEAEPRLAQALQVSAVPTVVALISGQLAPLFQGTRSREEIAALLDQVAQLAVANGITGRAQAGSQEVEGEAEAAVDPRFEAADAALQAGDYELAVSEFDKLITATPHDPEVIAGRAQAGLLARSATFDPATVVADASAKPNDVAAQLAAADLEIIQGASEQAFDRLLGLASELGADERETVRLRILELFEVVGRTDPAVIKARRRLSSVLF